MSVPYGTDRTGATYWLFSDEKKAQAHLYKETVALWKKNKLIRPYSFETVSVCNSELENFATVLQELPDDRNAQLLFKNITEELLPQLYQTQKQVERAQRRKAVLGIDPSNILSQSRTRRPVARVNYCYDSTDQDQDQDQDQDDNENQDQDHHLSKSQRLNYNFRRHDDDDEDYRDNDNGDHDHGYDNDDHHNHNYWTRNHDNDPTHDNGRNRGRNDEYDRKDDSDGDDINQNDHNYNDIDNGTEHQNGAQNGYDDGQSEKSNVGPDCMFIDLEPA